MIEAHELRTMSLPTVSDRGNGEMRALWSAGPGIHTSVHNWPILWITRLRSSTLLR
jgi:hypothetical protein